jgi:hypothetical protein
MEALKMQEISQAILSDTAAQNAAAITNATNKLEADKVNAQLTAATNQFNAGEQTKVTIANQAVAADVSKFNTQQANAREEFNANMATSVEIANSKILAEVSTANTAATNAANAVNAKNATDLSAAEYAQTSQTYRDLLTMSYKSGENELDRATDVLKATITGNASVTSSSNTQTATALGIIGGAFVTSGAAGRAFDGLVKIFTG